MTDPTSAAPSIPLESLLAPDGPVATRLPGFEVRPGQQALLRAIAAAIADGAHLVGEAGTGVGKSLAYLLPTVLSGEQTIVATHTKSLQDQLWDKDLPLIERILGRPVSRALLKGRSNYPCLLEIERLPQSGGTFPLFETREAASQWGALAAWIVEQQAQGGVGDLDTYPGALSSELRRAITVDGDTCVGASCRLAGVCFSQRAREKAREAQVVVVNYHLLLLDRWLRDTTDDQMRLLPDAPVVVLDEAHRLEEVATSVFGRQLTVGRWRWLARRLTRLAETTLAVVIGENTEHLEAATARVQEAAAAAQQTAELWFVDLQRGLGGARSRVWADREPPVWEPTKALDTAAQGVLRAVRPATWLGDDDKTRWQRWGRQVTSLCADLHLAMDLDNPDWVRYISSEEGRRTLTLYATPLEVAPLLTELVWERATTVAVSATLATHGSFDYWCRQVGAPDDLRTRIVPSPFDFRAQARLYIPQDGRAFRPPRDLETEYLARLSSEIEALLQASGGRALVLFTSYRWLRAVTERLRESLPWTMLVQGDAPRGQLLQRFREDITSVLFATRSFWEGVDVPGEALSLVIIDRLPFKSPDDPVWDARCRRHEQRGGNWFADLALPDVALTLKQGFGRLIRSRQDRGVVAILDGRLRTHAYGRGIVQSLPPAPVTGGAAAVARFFGEG